MCKKCHYCGMKGHISKYCPKEKKDSGKNKNLVGDFFEKFITKSYSCPHCNSCLRQLADFTPSCDLVCDTCGHKYEIKSKCLSVKKLPEDIRIKHGNYKEFINKLKNQSLDMFLIIYAYYRKSKTLSVRKIYYLPNNFIKNNNYCVITKIGDSISAKTEIKFTNIPEYLGETYSKCNFFYELKII